MPNYGGANEKCARCSKTVYLAEKKNGAGHAFHIRCFSCRTCNRKLDASTLSEHKGEIYCKTCYTRQFGVHGLAQGVTMTTEHITHENRPSRRSSYGSELDEPVIAYHQSRERAHSNDSTLRGEYIAKHNDEVYKLFPWKNDVLPEDQALSQYNVNLETNHTPQKDLYQKSSPIGFQRVIELPHNDSYYRHSAIDGDQHRQEYNVEGDQQTFTNRMSAIAQVPIMPPLKQTTSTIEKVETPLSPIRNDERMRNPSPILADNYRRLNNHEHAVNKSDSFSSSVLNEIYHELHDQNVPKSNVNMNIIATQNPVLKHKYSHSTSYESQQMTPTTQMFYREQSYSQDSSSSVNTSSKQLPLPISGYTSSSVNEEVLHDSASPASFHPSPNEYYSPHSSQTHVTDRHSVLPGQNERPESALSELVVRTSKLYLPSQSGKFSTIDALANTFRPLSYVRDPTNNNFDD